MTVLFNNRRQALKVRIVLWASVIVCAVALNAASVLYQTYGLSPGDGGVLRPLGERLTAAGIVAALGLAFAGGMLFFASLYAVRVTRDGDRIDLETMVLWGTKKRRFAVADFRGGSYFHGRQHSPRGQRVNAPWITLRVASRRVPFVIDVQAEEINRSALRKLGRGAVADGQGDRG